jgi:glutamine synthetase
MGVGVVAGLDVVGAAADRLEKTVADDLWPLPKYSEILFIK